MEKTKNQQSSKKPRSMLGQVVGSMQDIKTNEDFNNEHPDHDENGLKNVNSDGEDKENKKKLKIMEKPIMDTYHIGGMSCGGCVSTVKNKLSAVAGVTSVKIDLAKKEAEITSSQAIEADTLKEALRNSGYTIAELKA